MSNLEEKVLNTISKYHMIENGDKIVVGVSGGADSMTLLNVLNKLKNKFNLSLTVCHVDHGTRNGESKKDAEFVKERCDNLGLKCYTYEYTLDEEAKSLRMSPEEAGRKLRYDAFFDVMKKENANKIATAHNKNDSVETVLFNIARGTGLNGLCGIPKKKREIIRILSDISKEEILDYCKENNIEYKQDQTNFENNYARNKIRNEVIPYFENNINDNFLSNVSNMCDILSDEKDLIEELAKDKFNECSSSSFIQGDETKSAIKIDLEKFNSYHIALKKRILKKAITFINNDSFKDLSLAHINSVLDIIEKGTGKQITVLNGITASVSYSTLTITKDNAKETFEIITEETSNALLSLNDVNLESEKELQIDNKKIRYKLLSKDEREALTLSDMKNDSKAKYYFDFEMLKKKIEFEGNEKINSKVIFKIRKRNSGDKIEIDGGHFKKIKDLFIDMKLEKDSRDEALVFEKIEMHDDTEASSEIIAILGIRINPKYKVSENTKDVFAISFDM